MLLCLPRAFHLLPLQPPSSIAFPFHYDLASDIPNPPTSSRLKSIRPGVNPGSTSFLFLVHSHFSYRLLVLFPGLMHVITLLSYSVSHATSFRSF